MPKAQKYTMVADAATREALREIAQMLDAALPTGAIVIWTGPACPTGYIRDDSFAQQFMRGAPKDAKPGGVGGSASHSHPFTGTAAASGSTVSIAAGTGSTVSAAAPDHTHNVSGTTDSASSLPPYKDVLFCRKQ